MLDNKKVNINPFLLEMIIVSLYIIIASFLLLRLFALSKYYNVEAVTKVDSVFLAKNIAEEWKSGVDIRDLPDLIEHDEGLTYSVSEHYLDDSDIKVLKIIVYKGNKETHRLSVGRLDRE